MNAAIRNGFVFSVCVTLLLIPACGGDSPVEPGPDPQPLAEVSFDAWRSYFVPDSPRDMISADVNGDMSNDLVFAVSDGLFILVNNGDGTFSEPAEYDWDQYPSALCASDLDGDGDVDIAVTGGIYQSDDFIGIFMNDGNGAFGLQDEYLTLDAPRSICAGDLNGDDFNDLIVRNSRVDSVTVLLNNGDGTFASAEWYLTLSRPTSFVNCDFDNDSDLDIAIACPEDNSVAILWNDGHGEFFGNQTIVEDVAGSPYLIEACDLDGDEWKDIVAFTDDGHVSLIMNNAFDHTFTHIQSSISAYYVTDVSSGDLDGDGDIDLAFAQWDYNTLHIMENDGTGDFTLQADIHMANDIHYLIADDLDGDGDNDLACVNAGSSNTDNFCSVLLNRGDGSLGGGAALGGSGYFRSVATEDLDGDGDYDLAGATWSPGELYVELNNGDGTFASGINYHSGQAFGMVCIGDLSADAYPDLVVVDYGSDNITVLINNGEGVFDLLDTFDSERDPLAVSIGDINGDGKNDIALTSGGMYADDYISIYLQNSPGTFDPPIVYNGPYSLKSIFASDLDNDGYHDVCVTSTGSGLSVYMSGPNGVLGQPVHYQGYGYGGIWISDFDGDGDDDLAMAAGDVYVFPGLGDGTLGDPAVYPSIFRLRGITSDDLDDDGYEDLVLSGGSHFCAMMNLGSGSFSHPVEYYIGGSYLSSICAEDFDGDGDGDIVTGNRLLFNNTGE